MDRRRLCQTPNLILLDLPESISTDLTNPQTLNLYAFVNDNPESLADLDGHAAGCVSVMVSGSEDCNSANDGSGIADQQMFGRIEQSPHPPDPPCKDGNICSNTWVQKPSFWHKTKSWFSSPGSGGDSAWLSLFHRAWDARNPKVTAVTDVAGVALALGDHNLLGPATSVIGVVNDPQPPDESADTQSYQQNQDCLHKLGPFCVGSRTLNAKP